MVNQQKGVQQETAYSAVVVNDPRPCLYHLFMFLLYRARPSSACVCTREGSSEGQLMRCCRRACDSHYMNTHRAITDVSSGQYLLCWTSIYKYKNHFMK